ncbi:hypothetical protein PFISCL1PPCAC_1402, partial [Pristionchus fissidentatus]
CKSLTCFYEHPKCPNDGNCQDKLSCRYEHFKSNPTLLNIFNARRDDEDVVYNAMLKIEDRSHSRSRQPDHSPVNNTRSNRTFRPDAASNNGQHTNGRYDLDEDRRRFVEEQMERGRNENRNKDRRRSGRSQ